MNQIDNDKLGALVGKMLGDLGGAFSVPPSASASGPVSLIVSIDTVRRVSPISHREPD